MKERAEIILEQSVIDDLCPGISSLVVWLNRKGFETVDSGDGSNFENGMEGALEYPMVAILTRRGNMVEDADDLCSMLVESGADVVYSNDPDCPVNRRPTQPVIEATYSPTDGVAVIMIHHITGDFLDVSQ